MKMLIVEDELDLQNYLFDYFRKSDFVIYTAKTKFEAEDLLLINQFDIILLDITLPDGSGLYLIPIIKENQKDFGLIILTAKNSIDDKIEGLDLGADDYLTKPFHIAELNSRVKAIIRRKKYQNQTLIQYNEISVNIDNIEVKVNDEALNLTNKEFDLLIYLISNQDRVLTKESIAEHLWGSDTVYFDNFDVLYAQIKNVRKKITAAGGFNYLKTIHGIGYKFTDK